MLDHLDSVIRHKNGSMISEREVSNMANQLTYMEKGPRRRPSIRQKLRDIVGQSNIRGFMKGPKGPMRTIAPSPPPRDEGAVQSPRKVLRSEEPPPIAKGFMKRHDRDGYRKATRQSPMKRVSEKGLMTLQLEKGSLEDLKMSFEKGDDALYSIKSPTTTVQSLRSPIEKDIGARRMSHVEKEVVEDALPTHLKTRIEKTATPPQSRADSVQPEHDKLPELPKASKRYDVKVDKLVRPVSQASANPAAEKVAKTIETINSNKITKIPISKVDHSRTASQQSTAELSEATMVRYEKPVTIKAEKKGHPQPLGSNPQASNIQPASESHTLVEGKSEFSTSINDKLRRTSMDSAPSKASNRHSVGDVNQLLNTNNSMAMKRQSHPPLTKHRSFSDAGSSQGETTNIAGSGARPRRASGKFTSDRLAWIRELEEGSNGKSKNPGRAQIYRQLEGGVANKLAQFENKQLTGGMLARTNSVSSRVSMSSDAYSIEQHAAMGRLSRSTTIDDEFRKKLEDVAGKMDAKRVSIAGSEELGKPSHERKADGVPQEVLDLVAIDDGDQEAKLNEYMKGWHKEELVREINAAAERALMEGKGEKRKKSVQPQKPSGETPKEEKKADTKKPAEKIETRSPAPTVKPQSLPEKPAITPEVSSPPAISSSAKSVEKKLPEPVDSDEYDPFNYTASPLLSPSRPLLTSTRRIPALAIASPPPLQAATTAHSMQARTESPPAPQQHPGLSTPGAKACPTLDPPLMSTSSKKSTSTLMLGGASVSTRSSPGSSRPATPTTTAIQFTAAALPSFGK